jgi:hypothetical protein
MSGLRKLKAWVLKHELNPDNIREQLGASGVPVSTADCRTCADPCEDGRCATQLKANNSFVSVGHGEYPPRFTVDMETQMLGSVRPFCRQVSSILPNF